MTFARGIFAQLQGAKSAQAGNPAAVAARPRRLLDLGSGFGELCAWAASQLDAEVDAVAVRQTQVEEDDVRLTARDERERIGHPLRLEGKKQAQIASAVAGDIVAGSPARSVGQVTDAFRQRLSEELLTQRGGQR